MLVEIRLLDWRPDKMRGERERHERCVVLKNVFEPQLFDKEVGLLLEYQQDLREECAKCGDVRKVIIYDRNPEGVAQIFFREAEEADACIKLLNNRWFGQRQLTAGTWDGKTKYKIGETDAEIQARLQNWETFLNSGDGSTSTTNQTTSAGSAKPSELTSEPKEPSDHSEISTEKVSKEVEEKKSANESDAESGDETEGEEEHTEQHE
ncbi:hypothetical protein B566_EDAN008852 [Ephemera danica]|nr:hypothetical protein B566_EDAN008852 [Ephemera danica]